MDISTYLKLMVDKNASDLFFSVGTPVNIKIEGDTKHIGESPLTSADVRQLAYSIMSDDQISEYEGSLELNMAFSAANLGRFRVNVYRQRGETAMVIRYIKSNIQFKASFKFLNMKEALN